MNVRKFLDLGWIVSKSNLQECFFLLTKLEYLGVNSCGFADSISDVLVQLAYPFFDGLDLPVDVMHVCMYVCTQIYVRP